MERRGFLKALGGIAALIAVPTGASLAQAEGALNKVGETEVEIFVPGNTPIYVPSEDLNILERDRRVFLCSINRHLDVFNGVAGEDISSGNPCTIGADGKIYNAFYMAGHDIPVLGYSVADFREGRFLNLAREGRFSYGPKVIPGQHYYLGNLPGSLTTNKQGSAIALGLDEGRIQVRTTF